MILSNSEEQDDANNAYLIFRLGDEYYATPLLQVREVVEKQLPKHIPNTVDSYLGVINIRGEIVGAIDLRIKFGHKPAPSLTEALIVFDTEQGVIAALADQLEGVHNIQSSAIKTKPNIGSKISIDYIIAMAHFNKKILTIIDLHKILAAEEIVQLHNNQELKKENIKTDNNLDKGNTI